MNTEFLKYIDFFNQISVSVQDVTTEKDVLNHNKVVIVTYSFGEKSFVTKPLYYKEISNLDNVRDIDWLHKYFGEEVFWLDIEKHNWPKGKGESDLNNLVINDIAYESDEQFKSFLKKLANNSQNGFIQKITKEGRHRQYYHNLENNNHWHDLVIWIKETIKSRGKNIDRKFFQHLIFNWDKGKRTSLNANNPYKIVTDFNNNIYKMIPQINMKEKVNLLEYKKQIILQGPPGTGKTREAELIAKEMLEITEVVKLQNHEQYRIVQFHPSYTYEDFVRGIVAESKGDKIEYKNINKTIGKFAKIALENLLDSKKDIGELSLEKWVDEEFNQFVDKISETLEKDKIPLSENVDLVDLMDDAFLYIGENWKGYEHRMSFRDIKKAYLDQNLTRQDIVKNLNLSGSARQHATYYIVILNKFREFLSDKIVPTNQTKVLEKKYILVIDEINRANLSSVLGELIYALEYRGKALDSMYEVEGEQKIILPENLYIIGTMNTADRSVGHIDYAIRRRFAFVEVLPEKLEDNDDIFFNTSDFVEVAKLFIKFGQNGEIDFENAEDSEFLSDDFSAKDVALGHSYFIADRKKISEDNKQEYFKMKMKYEVIPILNEYLKDGVFNEKATVKIKEIEQRFA